MNDIILNEHTFYKTGYEFINKEYDDYSCYHLFDKLTGKESDVLDLTRVTDVSIIEIGQECCAFTENIKKVILPDSVIEINTDAFRACENLEEIIFSKNLRHIGYQAFWGCNFSVLTFPESLEEIDGSAFRENNLTKVTFGNNIKALYSSAFTENKINELIIPNSCEYIVPDILDKQKVDEINLYLPPFLYDQKEEFETRETLGGRIKVFENSLEGFIKKANTFKEINSAYKKFEGEKENGSR